MAIWTLYEDNGANLYAVRDGEQCVLIEERDALPDWRGDAVDIGSVVGAREHYQVATLDGRDVIERVRDGGAEAREYLESLAALP